MVKQNVYPINTMTITNKFLLLHFPYRFTLSLECKFPIPIKSHIMETQNLFWQEVSTDQCQSQLPQKLHPMILFCHCATTIILICIKKES